MKSLTIPQYSPGSACADNTMILTGISAKTRIPGSRPFKSNETACTFKCREGCPISLTVLKSVVSRSRGISGQSAAGFTNRSSVRKSEPSQRSMVWQTHQSIESWAVCEGRGSDNLCVLSLPHTTARKVTQGSFLPIAWVCECGKLREKNLVTELCLRLIVIITKRKMRSPLFNVQRSRTTGGRDER